MDMINLAELRVFVAAAEENNFSRAAERLDLSQSAVSQNIQSLERAYGVELFVRRGRSVELSEAGQTILPMAREVLNSARLLDDTMRNINSQVGGELLIGCSTSAGKYLMPGLLSMFQQDFPAVRSCVKVMDRNAVLENLLTEAVPLGITSKCFEHRNIECTPIFDDRIILIVPAHPPWTRGESIQPADLLDQPLIIREETSGTREAVVEGLKQHDITYDMLDVKMELGNAEAIELAVERGVGVAFVSEMIAARGLALGHVKKVDVANLDLHRTIFIARRIGYPFTRAQVCFWQFALEQRQKLNAEIWNSLTLLEAA
jgi:DNA-binding transcriptional LysR family regulator